MRILLAAATIAEIEPLINHYNVSQQPEANVTSFLLRSSKVDIIITGVGMVHTTYHITKQLAANHYDILINAGICGAFHSGLFIGEVVQVRSEIFSETGAEDHKEFRTIFELGLLHPDVFPYSNGRIQLPELTHIAVLKDLKQVNAITVNTVHGNMESIYKVMERYHPDTESMEGAACAFVCAQEKLDCLQIRAVSNYVEKRNRENWNIGLAVINLNDVLIRIINELTA